LGVRILKLDTRAYAANKDFVEAEVKVTEKRQLKECVDAGSEGFLDLQ
jgi:hypothetical protein